MATKETTYKTLQQLWQYLKTLQPCQRAHRLILLLKKKDAARQTTQTVPSLSYLSKWSINSHTGKKKKKGRKALAHQIQTTGNVN